jgi:acyl-CoA thioesterase-2
VHDYSRDGVRFTDRLSLERIDRDIFTGWCHAGAPLRAFGGQVAAQALVAAGTTVEEPGRRVHSLHGYFLRPGRTTDPIVYLVDRLRDGRSFTTRRVRAVHYGETIFAMSSSFAVDEPGVEHQRSMPEVPGPEDLARVVLPPGTDDRGPDEGFPEHQLLDLRLVPEADVRRALGDRAHQVAWMRTRESLPQDELTQVCTLTYFSDLTLAGTTLVPPHPAGRPGLDALIDHAMWFHSDFRADGGSSSSPTPPWRAASRPGRGEFFRRDGVLWRARCRRLCCAIAATARAGVSSASDGERRPRRGRLDGPRHEVTRHGRVGSLAEAAQVRGVEPATSSRRSSCAAATTTSCSCSCPATARSPGPSCAPCWA